jgi:hypothetical protein
MYERKASLDQRPIIMITFTVHLPRYIAIADPYLRECAPMSSLLIPILVWP